MGYPKPEFRKHLREMKLKLAKNIKIWQQMKKSFGLKPIFRLTDIYIIKNPILGTQFITNNDRQPSNEANVDENQWKIKVFLLDFYFCFYSLTHSQDDSVYEMNAKLALFCRRESPPIKVEVILCSEKNPIFFPLQYKKS